jgi:hypothetical protein
MGEGGTEKYEKKFWLRNAAGKRCGHGSWRMNGFN